MRTACGFAHYLHVASTQYTHLAEGAPCSLAEVVVREINPRERGGVAQRLRRACAVHARCMRGACAWQGTHGCPVRRALSKRWRSHGARAGAASTCRAYAAHLTQRRRSAVVEPIPLERYLSERRVHLRAQTSHVHMPYAHHVRVLGERRVLARARRGTTAACGWRGGRRASREARRRACSRRHSSLTPGRPIWLSERSSEVIVELEARTCHISHPVVEPRAVAGAQRGGSREGGGFAWPGVAAVRWRGEQAGHLRHGVDTLVAKPIVTQIQRPDLHVGQQRRSKCSELQIVPVAMFIAKLECEHINLRHHGMGVKGARAAWVR